MRSVALLSAVAVGAVVGWTACIIAAFAASKGQLSVGPALVRVTEEDRREIAADVRFERTADAADRGEVW